MEADFTRFYNTDLREACWGEKWWGVRRLMAHISHLPRESAYVRHLSGDYAYWDEQVEMTAKVLDAVQHLTYYTLRVNGSEPEWPGHLPRPGQSFEPETVSLAQLGDYLKG